MTRGGVGPASDGAVTACIRRSEVSGKRDLDGLTLPRFTLGLVLRSALAVVADRRRPVRVCALPLALPAASRVPLHRTTAHATLAMSARVGCVLVSSGRVVVNLPAGNGGGGPAQSAHNAHQ